MVRDQLKASGLGVSPEFNERGAANTRIEALSDGVFAIAIALLLISSEVPETFDDLVVFLDDFIPFSATIAILITIWYQHYIFFLRYGLTDANTVALNSILLFLILFFVYPLKFLFKVLYKLFSGILFSDYEQLQELFTVNIKLESTTTLMVIYGLGAFMIYMAFVLLYRYALSLRDSLQLTPLEIFETRRSLKINLFAALIPLASVLVAALRLGGDTMAFSLSGWIYFLYPIVMIGYSRIADKQKKRLLAELAASNESSS